MDRLKTLANALRFLSIDAVEKAQSGHPGMPLGMADIATVLWHEFLEHNPNNPHWFNRDRFVLSNGHGSMLLYALLHMSGYALPLTELQQFRQLHSKTPGHPEVGETPGVETTTGPLGQGLANAVGMALAERTLAARFNRPDCPVIDHHSYAFIGDGCLMEGISHEVSAFAGTQQLGKLIVFYDDNGISIDGPVTPWFNDDTIGRFKAYHWQVIGPIDGHNPEAIRAAIIEAKTNSAQPSLIICKTQIGYGSPQAGSEKSHGAPLGAQGTEKTREALNWPYAPFEIPADIYEAWDHRKLGQEREDSWFRMLKAYEAKYPVQYQELLRVANGDLPDDWPAFCQGMAEQFAVNTHAMATRKSSQICLEPLYQKLPELLGGSADLTGSNNTNWSKTRAISPEHPDGDYINYGVREFGMAAIMNGIALHGGLIPFSGTFLVFADYARNAIRLSALMRQRVIYVLTHDSIGLGEDGPTHQPIEHAAMLRLTPNIDTWRPADLLETWIAWKTALERRDGPSALLLSRQNLPSLGADARRADAIEKGAYTLYEPQKPAELILISTGSEVHLALVAAKALGERGLAVRVVSMPCVERFLSQDRAYQESVLPSALRARVAIEAAAKDYWYRFVGLDGLVIGLDTFGVSAPAAEAFDYFGFAQNDLIQALEQYYRQHSEARI